MKHYVSQADAFLKYRYSPLTQNIIGNPEQGQPVPHCKIVDYVIINVPVNIGRETYIKEYWINRQTILDIANQIKELEAQRNIMPYDNLPF